MTGALFAVVMASGCRQTATESGPKLAHFDLSPDDRRIIFNWLENGVSSIDEYDLRSGARHSVLAGDERISYYCPAYSPDGERVAFVRMFHEDRRFEVCIAGGENGNEVEVLTSRSNTITEVAFPASGDRVFFLAATEFKNYSPLARKAFHGFDLFVVDITTRKVSQLTRLSAYSMSSLARWGSDSIAFRRVGGEHGIYHLRFGVEGSVPEVYPLPDGTERDPLLVHSAELSPRWAKSH